MNSREITVMIAWKGAGGRLVLCSNLASKEPELARPQDVAASVYLGSQPTPTSPLLGQMG